MPAPIPSAREFFDRFGWLLPHRGARDAVKEKDVEVAIAGELDRIKVPFYDPSGSADVESRLWRIASNTVLNRDKEFATLQELHIDEFWAHFEPYLRGMMRDVDDLERKLASFPHGKQIAEWLVQASGERIEMVIGGSVGTCTVVGRADWDVLVVLGGANLRLEEIPGSDLFYMWMDSSRKIKVTTDVLRAISELYIEAFVSFERRHCHIMARFVQNINTSNDPFQLPNPDAPMNWCIASFTLSRKDLDPDVDLMDMIPAIRGRGDELVILASGSVTHTSASTKIFFKAVNKHVGLLQLVALVKVFVKAVSKELDIKIPGSVATSLGMEIAKERGWPSGEERIWSLSNLVRRCLTKMYAYLETDKPLLPPTSSSGDLLENFREWSSDAKYKDKWEQLMDLLRSFRLEGSQTEAEEMEVAHRLEEFITKFQN